MKTQRRSTILRILVLAVSAYMLVSLSVLWGQLVSSKRELAIYQKKAEDTELLINEYKNLLEAGNETKIIEKAARERLGFVYADEQVFVDVSGK